MKFSVIMACFNSEKWVGKAIRSVLKQTYTNWELVIFDDKSTDHSRRVIKKYSQKNNKIKLIESEKHLRCGGAYNQVAQHATGKICGVLDSDDALFPSAITDVLRVYKKTNADFVWTQFYLCDSKLKVLRRGFSKIPSKGKSFLDVRHAFSHWRTFKTNMRDKTMIFNPQYTAAVDKYLGYALEEVGEGVFFDKILYYYRRRFNRCLTFHGRGQMKQMREEFKNRREEYNIIPFPLRKF